MSRLDHSAAWRAVREHHEALAGVSLVELFAADDDRPARYTRSAAGITLDASRTHLVPAAFEALVALAGQQNVFRWRDRMMAGEAVNMTEGRAALHMALRLPELGTVEVDGRCVGDQVEETDRRMAELVDGIRGGTLRAAGGRTFTDVVHIGIGGSDLGPRLVCEALADPGDDAPRVHFVANIDPDERDAVLRRLDPARTLVIVASKTFTTFETLANARAIHQWVAAAVGDEDATAHFVAVTGAGERAAAFGIDRTRILPLPEWVGGRYSLWSAIGLPVAIALGMPAFNELRAGAADMDRHFRDAPASDNLPLWLALIGIWYGNFSGLRSHAVIPYAEALACLPAYLQQLEMESNGKRVDRTGEPVTHATAPAIWGAVGTTAQHAIFQWLHQGTETVPCDFVVPVRPGDAAHDALFANCLAQASALANGRTGEELRRAGVAERERPHRIMPGNRPSVTLLLDGLTPRSLGALLALYEHKVFCQAMIWEINPFDQWGVERGKELAGALLPAVSGSDATDPGEALDPAARALLRRYRSDR